MFKIQIARHGLLRTLKNLCSVVQALMLGRNRMICEPDAAFTFSHTQYMKNTSIERTDVEILTNIHVCLLVTRS
jgi:hypothetical protein